MLLHRMGTYITHFHERQTRKQYIDVVYVHTYTPFILAGVSLESGTYSEVFVVLCTTVYQ